MSFSILNYEMSVYYKSYWDEAATGDILEKNCSWIFTTVTGKRIIDLNFILKRLQHKCCPVTNAKFLNFKKHLFWKASTNGCFCKLSKALLILNNSLNLYDSWFCGLIIAVRIKNKTSTKNSGITKLSLKMSQKMKNCIKNLFTNAVLF